MSNKNHNIRQLAAHSRQAQRLSLRQELATTEVEVYQPALRWVVKAYLADGDKAYLDSWEIIGIFLDYQEAITLANEVDALGCRTTDDFPCPPTILDLRDIKECWECREYLEYKAELEWLKSNQCELPLVR